MTDDDARSGDNKIFCYARGRGYLDIAQWLHANFDLKLREEDIAKLLQDPRMQQYPTVVGCARDIAR